jgi:peptidoglycan/LPS O-acetylase OafA/YrhL
MIALAYLVLLGAVAWAVVRWRRPWVRRLSGPGRRRLRLAMMVVTVAVAGLGVLLIAAQAPEEQSGIYRWTGYAVGAALLGGALLYAVGLYRWHGGAAFALRLWGWVLVTAALMVPSTLTLALPLAAAMVVTLATVPPDTGTPRRPVVNPSVSSG